jgi:hypothetical protein
MRLSTLFFLMLTCSSAFAVEFNSLSRKTPVTMVYTSEFDAYVDISFSLSAKSWAVSPLFLRVQYIIGNDTLNDNLSLTENYKGVLKQILMRQGEHLTAKIMLVNADVESVADIQGSFRAASNTALMVSKDLVGSAFPGNVWLRDHNPLFRLKFDRAEPREVQLTFHFDGNYEFSNLHFKVKVISPEQGILFLPRTVDVTDDKVLNYRDKTVTITLEGVNFAYAGSFYLQVMHAMDANRVNGVKKITYEVIEK